MALFSELPARLELERDAEDLAEPGSGDPREDLVLSEFAEVAGGSTAWVNLLLALDSADTEVGEVDLLAAKSDARGVAAYWEWAWNTYCLAQAEVGPAESEARRLSVAYNLEDLPRCKWCEVPDAEANLSVFGTDIDDVWYVHKPCLAEQLRELGL